MNKRIMAFAVTASLAVLNLIIGVPVLAHEGEHGSSSEVMAQTSEQNSPKPNPEELKARLQQRKDALKVRLNTAQKTRLQASCKNAQGKLQSVAGRINGIETSRNEVYGHMIEHLEELSTKLKAKNVDTVTLDEQINALKDQMAAFKTSLTEYKQAVVDLAAMDCQADPEAFKASLDQAREFRKTLHVSGQNIRMYVKETIKPTLVTIRAELVAKAEVNSNSEEVN